MPPRDDDLYKGLCKGQCQRLELHSQVNQSLSHLIPCDVVEARLDACISAKLFHRKEPVLVHVLFCDYCCKELHAM